MKKIFFISIAFILLFLVTNVNVSAARSGNEGYTSDPISVNDSTQERFILNTTAVEQSTVLYEQICWSGLRVKGNLGQTLSFNYNNQVSEGYSFAWAIGISIQGGVSIPCVADAKLSVSNTFTNTWSETDTFSNGVTISQPITNASQVGIYEMVMIIPQTKKTLINSDWTREVRTRTRFLGFLWWNSWGEWEVDNGFDGGDDQNYYTFKNTGLNKPYLEVRLVEQTPPPPPSGGGGGGGGGGGPIVIVPYSFSHLD